MVKLLFFGCWGYLGKGSGLKKVFASLNNTVSEGDHVVILGDNYYPSEKIKSTGEGESKKKNYFTSLREIGEIFEYLSILNKKNCHIHLLMGNHEYKDDTLKLEDYIKHKKGQGGGLILIQKGDSSKFKTFALEYNYIKTLGLNSDIGMCPIEGLPHTLLLKLDTNMFTKNKKGEEVTLPYKYNGSFTAQSLIGDQDFSDIQRIFICGHIPIGSKIYDKDKKKYKLDQSLPIELYDLIFELVKNIKSKNEGIKIYYMCADTHYFQQVEIKMKRGDKNYQLEQFVAGTGGNKLDPWVDDTENEIEYKSVKGQTEFHYKIVETQREHGYVMVLDTGEPEFVSVSQGGGYKKIKSRRKPKRKTKKLKRKSKKLKRKSKKRKTKTKK